MPSSEVVNVELLALEGEDEVGFDDIASDGPKDDNMDK